MTESRPFYPVETGRHRGKSEGIQYLGSYVPLLITKGVQTENSCISFLFFLYMIESINRYIN